MVSPWRVDEEEYDEDAAPGDEEEEEGEDDDEEENEEGEEEEEVSGEVRADEVCTLKCSVWNNDFNLMLSLFFF